MVWAIRMASKKSDHKPTSGAATEARALVDLPALSVLAGGLIVADQEVIASLVSAGQADDHPEAVAYAKA